MKHRSGHGFSRKRASLTSLMCILALGSAQQNVLAAPAAAPPAIPRAVCGPKDRSEKVLQGQVPLPDRVVGFKGYTCNLEEVGAAHSKRADGMWQQFALVRDHAGHTCGYGGPAEWTGRPGTTVVDLTDPAHARETALITTPGLVAPGEGIRVHQGRGLLVGAYYNNASLDTIPSAYDVRRGFDIYDVGADCRYPKLLTSTMDIKFPTAGLTTRGPAGAAEDRIYGHEGAMAPDGNTYWIADNPHAVYHAIDIKDPRHPKLIGNFASPAFLKGIAGTHGLSVSDDGNRVYAVTAASPGRLGTPGVLSPENGEYHDGLLVLDTSEIQARKPNAKVRLISEVDWSDGSAAQMTIPANINGKQYVVVTDEAGPGGASRAGIQAACAAGRGPFGIARIYDVSDEAHPKLVKKVSLEVDDPKSCGMIQPEVAVHTGTYLYDIHMCSVDNRDNATTLACGYFNAGIRVFDIRDPAHTKEIAYYVPPAKAPGEVGWCAAIPILDAAKGMVYSSCADSGVVALKFRPSVWPFPTSTTPPDKQL